MCICKSAHPDFASSVLLTPSQAVSKHLSLDWTVDFTKSTITGHVDILCESQQVGECMLTLDSRDLVIHSVNLVSSGIPSSVKWEQRSTEFPSTLGSPIFITLPDSTSVNQQYTVRVAYTAGSASSALQWLTPDQTSSKKFPFMFSQCQAIHARSLVPCQDLCQVKTTYSATVRSAPELTVVMSAIKQSSISGESRFEQKVPIPAYLIAIACGDLSSVQIGPRSTVWAEPSVVARAAWEFEDTEKMIQVAESLCGPYRFGIFDLLVLPPSFPYGGMENPCLTFVTPTLLAGDKSQVPVIAHELAHSWSGNLVTNETWTDFWLNEGLTVFTETKIVEKLFGSDAAAIRTQEGWDHLGQFVGEVGEGHNFTKLCPEMTHGEDPDDAFSVIPYEKGAALFRCLEHHVGAAEFGEFIRKFFNHFAFKTVSSTEFSQFFTTAFPSVGTDFPWTTWFSHPGMPVFQPHVDEHAIAEATTLAQQWLADGDAAPAGADVIAWVSGKKSVFLNTLLAKSEKLTKAKVMQMKDLYKFLETNCEIRCSFITLMLRVAGSEPTGTTAAVQLATEQGRMKYTRPMYKELFKVDAELARKTFREHKGMYHPICAKMVSRDLGM